MSEQNVPGTQCKPKRFIWLRTTLKWLVRCFMVLLLLVIGYIVGMNYYGEAQLQKALAHLEAKGLPTDLASLRKDPPLDEEQENGARLYMAAFALARLPYAMTKDIPGFSSDPPKLGAKIDESTAERLANFVKKQADCYRLLEEARNVGQCVFIPDSYMDKAVESDHASKIATGMREAAGHWAVLSWYAQSQGNGEQALKACENIIDLSESIADEPFVISEFMRIAVIGIAVKNLERTLSRCTVSPGDLSRVRKRLLAAGKSFDAKTLQRKEIGYLANNAKNLARAMAHRYMVAEQILDMKSSWFPTAMPPKSGSKSWKLNADRPVSVRKARMFFRMESLWFALCPGEYKNVLAINLRHYADLLDQMDVPAPQLFSLGKEWATQKETDEAAYNLGRWIQSVARVQAILKVAATALSIEEYRLANGTWPKNLQAIGLDDIIDPYSDGTESLQYSITKEGSVIIRSAYEHADFQLLSPERRNVKPKKKEKADTEVNRSGSARTRRGPITY